MSALPYAGHHPGRHARHSDEFEERVRSMPIWFDHPFAFIEESEIPEIVAAMSGETVWAHRPNQVREAPLSDVTARVLYRIEADFQLRLRNKERARERRAERIDRVRQVIAVDVRETFARPPRAQPQPETILEDEPPWPPRGFQPVRLVTAIQGDQDIAEACWDAFGRHTLLRWYPESDTQWIAALVCVVHW